MWRHTSFRVIHLNYPSNCRFCRKLWFDVGIETYTTVYLFHEQDGEDVRALELTMTAPMTRAKCINAAEMAAYGLQDTMDVAAFASSLSRKERTGEDLDEVREHDDFIAQVKTELTALGIV